MDIKSMTLPELQEEMAAIGKRAFGQNNYMNGSMSGRHGALMK